MIAEQKRQDLTHMFELLIAWPQKPELLFFIRYSLNIITRMCEDDQNTQIIARNLKIIIPREYLKNYIINLRAGFSYSDAALPANYRGFVSLFDEFMLDNKIIINNYYIIEKMPENYQKLAHIFCDLIHDFDIYEQFACFFDTNNSKIITSMYLRALCKICVLLNLSDNLLLFFLKDLGVDKNILNIMNYKINLDKPDGLLDKNILVLFLCYCASQHVLLNNFAQEQLKIALEHAQFPELSVLEESGFIAKNLPVV